MKINKITLNNIRSYQDAEIEFPEGSTLLSGDIGSGKTSILLGIEFALFGLQPGQRGSAILRNGENSGGVKIEFEVDGKQIIVERTLKKSKTISQDYAAITINKEKKEMSVTELKNLVLEILQYPKEFSKKQNILYKFTVYTPQEEMKQIILQDAETRLNTLRHVFGVDKYKKVLENASFLISKIREEKRIKEALTANLEENKLEIVAKEKETESRRQNLESLEKELFEKSEITRKISEEKQEISLKIQEKNKLQQEIDKTKLMISTKEDSVSDNKKFINQLKEQIKELQSLSFENSKIQGIENEINFLKQEKQKLNEINLEISSRISSLNLKNSENEKIKEKIQHIEICPTCMQDVNMSHKNKVISKLDSNTSENLKKIKLFAEDKQQTQNKIQLIESNIISKEKQVQELRILKIKLQSIDEKKQRLLEIEKSNFLLEKDVNLLKKHIETLAVSVLELSKFDNLFEEKQKHLESAMKQEKESEIKFAELKKEIEFFERHVQEMKNKIEKIEQTKKELVYLNDIEEWISKQFVPLISFIEKNVMTKLKSEFSALFSEWFSMLVADSFNIRLGDDFTPIVEQQDYEIDYNYLSGGERTAIALAYRLALNQVINSLISKIKTKDLVILDEPTDGFSDAQLDKMRSVLDELNVAQLIIVSHEQKIEGFVDNVIRFKKNNNMSYVEK